jgi:hypothetical protein
VDVCATESVFAHVTVVPTPIVRSSGAKARLPSDDAPDGIDTEEDGPPGVGGVDGDGAAGDGEDELPHAMVNTRRDATTGTRIENIRTSRVMTPPAQQRFAMWSISETRKEMRFAKSNQGR